LHVINERDFPEELREDWNWIVKTLTKKVPVVGEDGEVFTWSVDNTLRLMRNKTGSIIAKRILMLSDRLRGYLEDIANTEP